MTPPPPALAAGRAAYGETAVWFHWVTALLMAAILPIAWVMTNMAENDPNAGPLYMLHKSIGLTIGAIVLLRLLWRATHPAPPIPGPAGRGLARLALLNHWLLYAILVAMPLSGYLLAATGTHPTTWFDLFPVPGIGPIAPVHRIAAAIHLCGQWAVYALVSLHLLGAAFHVAIARDGTLARILPRQAG